MPTKHDQKTLHQIILDASMNTTTLTNQSRLALTPLRIQALRVVGFSTTFLAGMMLRSGKEASIGSPLICVNGFVTIIRRHIRPKYRKHGICSISENESQNLSNKPRNGYPNPERGSQLNTDFVNLDDICLRRSSEASARGRYQGDLTLTDLLLYVRCVFFRISRIVRRETLSARAIPRWEILSWSVAIMAASFSGVMARLLGLRQKVLLQPWHRHRWVSAPLLPCLMQSVLSQ